MRRNVRCTLRCTILRCAILRCGEHLLSDSHHQGTLKTAQLLVTLSLTLFVDVIASLSWSVLNLLLLTKTDYDYTGEQTDEGNAWQECMHVSLRENEES